MRRSQRQICDASCPYTALQSGGECVVRTYYAGRLSIGLSHFAKSQKKHSHKGCAKACLKQVCYEQQHAAVISHAIFARARNTPHLLHTRLPRRPSFAQSTRRTSLAVAHAWLSDMTQLTRGGGLPDTQDASTGWPTTGVCEEHRQQHLRNTATQANGSVHTPYRGK